MDSCGGEDEHELRGHPWPTWLQLLHWNTGSKGGEPWIEYPWGCALLCMRENEEEKEDGTLAPCGVAGVLICHKNVLKVRNILARGLCFDFWKDPWTLNRPDFLPKPNNQSYNTVGMVFQNLMARGVDMERNNCVHGGNSPENEVHVFFHCEIARRIWFGSPWKIRWEAMGYNDLMKCKDGGLISKLDKQQSQGIGRSKFARKSFQKGPKWSDPATKS
ncbi:hypothetical protein FEM48_Zijuj04G0140500 [Ziziphus jujuba var. spinosa]|uniref:Reverse transcriptase zinc-binding domain-containing protein n=1 Tax=Ziziphus jujuba var. spinosa TaxID=714518 RepID=A0A978VKA9_ZIZJJ|nr:hypothetical protein FEM48_Zijuj04G0140500 [Ziziphus jujuba var. spinosa]